jgi:hypothetical protein
MKPYCSRNTLVIGRLYCSDDIPELYTEIKPFYAKVEMWIKTHWKRLPTGQYIGPEAIKLENDGAKKAYFPLSPDGQIEGNPRKES